MSARFLPRPAVLAALLLAPAISLAQSPFLNKTWPRTDFSGFQVDPGEIFPAGPEKDGIPAIDDPRMIPAARVSGLDPREPVLTVLVRDQPARAYPLRYLLWHEVVNDRIGGVPVAISYSAFCDSAMVWDRRLPGGETVEFGVSGLLRRSDTILFDRETESWWQQATGRAIVGARAGTELTALPAWQESWEAFRASHRDGLVMGAPAFDRPYGTTPFPGYDSRTKPPLYNGRRLPHDVPPLTRVVRVGNKAWPMPRLMGHEMLHEARLTLSWTPGMASPLDAVRIAESRDIGMVRVKDSMGHDVPFDAMFAFAFDAFWPRGEWMLGQCDETEPGHPC